MPTIFNNDLSKEIYEQTYCYNGETIDQTHDRVAKNIASIEKDPEHWTELFKWALENFRFVPGGRITSNAGLELKGTTYINCFVDGFIGKSQDSMQGIHDALGRQMQILKSEGGYGFCADVMRPRGAYISGISNESPGAVSMLDIWDTSSDVITKGSGRKSSRKDAKIKIRKGAQMVTMSCWHPDIEEFITSKQTPGRLTKFNMSVLITDDLISAMEQNKPWDLVFPDYEADMDLYNDTWNGDIRKWVQNGGTVKIYKTYENANELWDIIMTSTYNRNEPGVLFIDRINDLNNLWYCEHLSATNPCAEQVLPIGGCCLLGSINLTQFIDFPNRTWDYKGLKTLLHIVVRFLDNVNDISKVPLSIQKENLLNKRRIGLGFLGYGSALLMLKQRYGSPEAIKLTDELVNFMYNVAYQESALLAKEKGPFPLYQADKYLASKFIKNLHPDTIKLIKTYGIRNSHIGSIQPTGNTSIYANNVSGGLEPLFMPVYVRTSIMPYPPPGLNKPENIDWVNKTFDCDNTKWNWIQEGDDHMLSTTFDGYTWKVDKNRGLLRETVVKDYAVRYLESIGEWDQNAPWAATTTQLTIKEHLDTMESIYKMIDSSCSKTVNIPNDYPYEDFKNIYLNAYHTGVIKGVTTYRAGTMATVLASVEKKDDNTSPTTKKKTSRPESIECNIHTTKIKNERWMVIVGLVDDVPYEVFAFKQKDIYFNRTIQQGRLIKVNNGTYDANLGVFVRGRYDLVTDYFTIENLRAHFETNEEVALTRMISTALRHGTDIQFIYEQLMKSEGTIVSFSKAIARTLSYYIKDEASPSETLCGSCNDPQGLVFQEGCILCKNCGYSKCG